MSNKTKLSVLPVAWKNQEIESLAIIGPQNGLYKQEKYYGSGWEMVHMTENFAQDLILSGGKRRVQLTRDEENKFALSKGDILFGRRSLVVSGVGKPSLVGDLVEPLTFESSIIRVRLDKKQVLPEFAFQYLISIYGKAQMKTIARQVAVSGITGVDLKSYQLPVPPLSEQQKIVAILKVWDEAIEKIEALIIAKQRQFKWLLSTLVEKNEPVNFYCLSEVANFIDGYAFKSSEYRNEGKYKVLTIANVQDGFMVPSFTGKMNLIPSQINAKQVLNIGDILISMTGNVGRVCKVNIESCLLNQRVGKIEPKPSIDAEFLFFCLLNRKFLLSMSSLAQGGAQGNLSKKDILKYKIPSLPLSEQNQIVYKLNAVHQEIILFEKLAEKYREQKFGLMQQLLTGKKRVKQNKEI